MAYDGIQNSNRVDPLTERKVNAKVVDTILNARAYAARLISMGKPFTGKTFDIPMKVVDSGAGEFFSGGENLNSSASDTLINLSFSHTAFQQPAVSLMLESFANSGDAQSIDLDIYKLEEATAEAVHKWGHAVYGLGTGSQPLGAGAIADDGTDVGTIGGQSRTTYSVLQASRHAATAGILSLAVLATREDAVTASGMDSEEPNINVTTKTNWTLYESLLHPNIRAEYASVGYNALAIRGNEILKSRADLKGHAGFTALTYRGKPVMKDDDATSGRWFMFNERYFGWRGRTVVPTKYQGKIEKISLGDPKNIEGVAAGLTPPTSTGWFFQPYQMHPTAASMVARFYCIGQVVGSQFRRQGVETGISTI